MSRKQNGEALKVRAIVALQGAAISLSITVVLCSATAVAVLKGVIAEHAMTYMSLLVILLSSLTGSLVISYRLQSCRVLSCITASLVYMICLSACAITFFDDPLKGVWARLAVTIGSGIAASLITVGKGRGRTKRSKRIRV